VTARKYRVHSTIDYSYVTSKQQHYNKNTIVENAVLKLFCFSETRNTFCGTP